MSGLQRAKREQRGAQATLLCLLLLASAYAGRLAYHNHFQHAALGEQPLVAHAPELVVGRSVTDGRREPLVLTEIGLPTLLLVVSAECPYCAENMPRWARLLEALDREPSANLDVIALSTSGSEETAAYLAEHGIAPARVLLIDRRELAGLGLRGVPGTVAVTPGSPTLRSWAGVLSDKDVDSIVAWALASQETG